VADDSLARGRELWGRGFHVAAGASVDTEAYDGYIGRWSRLFVASLLDAATVGPGDLVLDVASGTGEAAIAAAHRGARGVVGADVAMAMVTAAADRLVGEWFWPVVADGQCLPFGAGVFDAVVCQLGLMFFPEPHRGLDECRRVVRVGGRVAVSVVGTAERAPPWGVLADVLGHHRPEQTADLHVSFRLGDHDQLVRLLTGAGLDDVHVARHVQRRAFTSFDDYWAPIEISAGQLPQTYRSLPTATRDAVRNEVRERLGSATAGGGLDLDLEVLVGAGIRR
jgi:SAM-dependent methyltransferase